MAAVVTERAAPGARRHAAAGTRLRTRPRCSTTRACCCGAAGGRSGRSTGTRCPDSTPPTRQRSPRSRARCSPPPTRLGTSSSPSRSARSGRPPPRAVCRASGWTPLLGIEDVRRAAARAAASTLLIGGTADVLGRRRGRRNRCGRLRGAGRRSLPRTPRRLAWHAGGALDGPVPDRRPAPDGPRIGSPGALAHQQWRWHTNCSCCAGTGVGV